MKYNRPIGLVAAAAAVAADVAMKIVTFLTGLRLMSDIDGNNTNRSTYCYQRSI